MNLGPKGLALIKSFEGFVPYVYDDLVPPVKGKYREWDGGPVRGTLTIGYGHTNAARHPLKCTLGTRVTEQQATQILDVDLDECEQAVNKYVKVPLSQGQFDALTSFTYNCGVGNLKKVIIPLNQGDYDGTQDKIGQYIRSKGQVLNGLVRRRTAEQKLWDDDYGRAEPGGGHEAYYRSITQDDAIETPKQVTPEEAPKSAMGSTINWAAGTSFLSAVAGFLTDYRVVAVIVAGVLAAYIIWARSGKPDIKGWFK